MNNLKRFIKEEEAMGTLEVILISAVLIGAAVLFKEGIRDLIDSLMNTLTKEAGNGITN